jgi:ChrR Cupin-like domain
MSHTRIQIIPFARLALGLTLIAAPAVAQEAHVLVPANQVKWGPAPPILPAGAQIAVLEGNPSEKGPVTLRLRFPADYKIPAHWHSMTERVTVLSGTFHIGMGDKLDREASTSLAQGGFVSLPAKMRHFAWTSTPTVVQVSLDGPFDLFYVNPADNPVKTQ